MVLQKYGNGAYYNAGSESMKRTNIKNSVSKNWFRDWANEYDKTLGKVKRHHKLLDLVVKASGVKKNNRVLDIGCGTGLLSLKFLNKTDCSVTGIDISSEMLAIFRNKIRKLGISGKVMCKLMDTENMTTNDNSYDIIASTVTLHHVKNKYPVIKKISDMLNPGGKFVLGDIDMDTTGNLNDPKRLLRIMGYLNQELALALKEGGIDAFRRMYDNGKKHILNDGEYCVSFRQWKKMCRRAKFRNIRVVPLPDFRWFKVLVAVK